MSKWSLKVFSVPKIILSDLQCCQNDPRRSSMLPNLSLQVFSVAQMIFKVLQCCQYGFWWKVFFTTKMISDGLQYFQNEPWGFLVWPKWSIKAISVAKMILECFQKCQNKFLRTSVLPTLFLDCLKKVLKVYQV